MSFGRAILGQVALPTIVIACVFAVGFHTGTSASLSTMQAECTLLEGTWRGGFCVISEIYQ